MAIRKEMAEQSFLFSYIGLNQECLGSQDWTGGQQNESLWLPTFPHLRDSCEEAGFSLVHLIGSHTIYEVGLSEGQPGGPYTGVSGSQL